jgi:hypothetical protein
MGFQVYDSTGQELQKISGTAGGDLTGTYPNPTLAKGPTYETTLPSSPIDGQEIYYAADATNGVIWHLRYRSGSSSSYKWEFIGGAPLTDYATVSGTTTAPASTYTDFRNGTTYINRTVPLAGEYQVWGQASVYNSTVTGADIQLYAATYSSSNVFESSTLIGYASGSSIGEANLMSGYALTDLTITSANKRISLTFRTGIASGVFYLEFQRVRILPIRVG